MKLNETMNGKLTKISLLYRGLSPSALWRNLVESHVKKLQHLASIASARIFLERQHGSNAVFRVSAVLEVPGPDYHAEASDYTLRAALLKVTNNLRKQMQSRRDRQMSRKKNKAQVGCAHGGFQSR
jgi:ribosome-associated translation inhibitor RaiA